MGIISRLLRGKTALTRDDRAFVLDLVPKGSVCGEVGSWKGDFAARIVETMAPAKLHLIDPWRFDPSVPRRWYGGGQAKSQADMDAIHDSVYWRFQSRSEVSVIRLPSIEAAPGFPDAYFDWLYIDGDHSYDAVLADLYAWIGKVKVGGYLVCDDYLWTDEAGEQSVKAAVRTFLHERVVSRGYERHGQYVIQV